VSIKTGRYGEVMFDPTGGTTYVTVASLNTWKMSQKTARYNVTCFGDVNLVYVPGLKDVSGTLAGFWNSTDTTLWTAVDAATPGSLKLVPNSTEPLYFWSGLAYIDADIDTGAEKAPAFSGTFSAAGPWTMAT
jgi:hypothetical protein